MALEQCTAKSKTPAGVPAAKPDERPRGKASEAIGILAGILYSTGPLSMEACLEKAAVLLGALQDAGWAPKSDDR